MVKLFLHIGSTKTGSTALQSTLKFNENTLKDRDVLYPETFLAGVAHHDIVNVLNGDSIERGFKALHAEIESANMQHVIISTETLFFLQEQIKDLAEQLSRYDVYPIVYLRRQDIWFEAMYTQTIKHEEYRYTGLIRDTELLNMYDYYMNYSTVLEKWQEAFSNKIIVKLYESVGSRFDILSDFCDLLPTVEANYLKKPNYAQSNNASLSHSSIRFLQAANSFDTSNEKHDELIDLLGNYSSKKTEQRNSYEFLSDFEKRSILKRYAASNLSVHKNFNVGNAASLFSLTGLGYSIEHPDDTVDNESLARITYSLNRQRLVNDAADIASENTNDLPLSRVPNFKGSGTSTIFFNKPGNDDIDDLIQVFDKNPDTTVTLVELDKGTKGKLNSLFQTKDFSSNDVFQDAAIHKKSMLIYASQYIALLQDMGTRNNACAYFVEREHSLRQLVALQEENKNHVITGLRSLSEEQVKAVTAILADTEYQLYIAKHLNNNGLQGESLILATNVMGVNNEAVQTLCNNWTMRVDWFLDQHDSHLDVLGMQAATDLCFSMAVIDSGLYVNQIC